MTKPIQVWEGDGVSPEELAELEATQRIAAEAAEAAAAISPGAINIQIQSTQITSQRRKLKARWSVEAAQELKDHHGVDLAQGLTEEVIKAINNGTFTPP